MIESIKSINKSSSTSTSIDPSFRVHRSIRRSLAIRTDAIRSDRAFAVRVRLASTCVVASRARADSRAHPPHARRGDSCMSRER